jgi:transposase
MDERTAGIDLASEEHRLVVAGSDGRRLEERRFAHSEDGVSALVRRLLDLDVAWVAIEQPNGLIVDRLLDAGVAVVAVHPNQLAAARDRYRSGGGKSDGFDAYVPAELARTDIHRLRPLEPDRDETKALRALTHARADLVQQRVALANQPRAQLDTFWPGAARIFFEVDSPICLAFLERYPSPSDTRGLGEKRLAAFLARNGYCGRKNANDLLSRLRAAPEGRAGELESEACRAVVLGLVAALKPLVEQIRLLTSEIRGPLADHPDEQIFQSLFRDPKSVVTAAELLAEIGDRRERHPSSTSLEAIAGQSALAVESGKRKIGSFRRACNKTLRSAVGVLADSSRKHNPWAQKIYADAIARGKDHPHALRILGRAWLRIIWRMSQDRTPYDPSRHKGLNRPIAARG